MAETNIKISLEIADQAAQKALSNLFSNADQATKSLNKLGDSGSGSFNQISLGVGKAASTFDIFSANLAAGVALKAIEALLDISKQLFDTFIIDGVKAASAQEDAINQLNQSLAQSGQYSKQTSEDFQKFAEQMQNTTRFSDDVIEKNAALLESLTGLDGQGLQRATKAALDFSAATGKDLSTSIEAVAKAANGNVTSLQKLGIEIQKGRDDSETFANALQALEGRFGGRATADINTFSGAIALASNQFEELQESFGILIVQNPVFVQAIKEVGKIINEMVNTTKDAGPALAQSIGQGFIFIIDASKALIAGLDAFARVFTAGFRALETEFLAWATVITKGLSFVGLASEDTVNTLQEMLVDKSKTVFKAFTEDTGLSKAGEALSRIGFAAEDGFAKLKRGAETSIEPINNTTKAVKGLSDEQEKFRQRLKAFAEDLVKKSEDTKAGAEEELKIRQTQYETESAALKTQLDQNLISYDQYRQSQNQLDVQYDDFRGQQLADQYDADQDRLQQALDQKLISNSDYLKAQSQLDKKYVADKALLDADEKKRQQKVNQANYEAEVDLQNKKKQAVHDTLGNLTVLMQTSSKELFTIGKAAAIANATISTYEAVAKTMAFTPYPFNIPLAIAQGAAGAVQVANIAKTQPSFADGGIVPGTSFSGDQIQANVNSGEMILNRGQQANLFQLANGGGQNSLAIESKLDLIAGILNKMAASGQIIEIDGREIVNVMRDYTRAGFTST